MEQEYFRKWIEWSQNKAIPHTMESIITAALAPRHKAQSLFQIFIYHFEELLMRYSRGDHPQEIILCFPAMIDAWERADSEETNAFSATEMALRKQFSQNLDFYVVCLWLVSLAICLEVNESIFARLLKLCGNEGKDWLFEQMVSFRAKGRTPTDRLLYPKTYNLLKFALQEKRLDERNRLLRGFVQRWYPSLSKTYWHDSHTGPDGGGYFGYWCFELAAAVKVFNLDDGVLQESSFYPKDLARFHNT